MTRHNSVAAQRLSQLLALSIFLVGAAAAASLPAHAHRALQPPAQSQPQEPEATKPELRTDPAAGATLTRPARTLRIWFQDTPNVANCTLELEGPEGALTVTGLHTMGENDLMARVSGPMPDGEYTATYKIESTTGERAEGSWSFAIKRASSHH